MAAASVIVAAAQANVKRMSGGRQPGAAETVLVTGGAGYVGCRLVPRLLAAGHRVIVYDILYFGRDGLPADPLLEVIEGDIRDVAALAEPLASAGTVIHLACISNDPSFELDERLSRATNYECFEPLVVAARDAGVGRFIYCSTSSVYGVSDAPDVTEDHPLVPSTDYNRYKGMCEPLLFRHASQDFTCVAIRPATVCGYSPRMRLDLTVNILTNHAIANRRINVFGGDQLRPNLHIEDLCDLYGLLVEAPAETIQGQIFNAGNENLSVAAIAAIVKRVVEDEFPQEAAIEMVTTQSDDKRSYHISSDKIRRVLGFAPSRSIEDAVRDLCRAFRDGRFPDSMDDDRYFNVRRMKSLKAA